MREDITPTDLDALLLDHARGLHEAVGTALDLNAGLAHLAFAPDPTPRRRSVPNPSTGTAPAPRGLDPTEFVYATRAELPEINQAIVTVARHLRLQSSHIRLIANRFNALDNAFRLEFGSTRYRSTAVGLLLIAGRLRVLARQFEYRAELSRDDVLEELDRFAAELMDIAGMLSANPLVRRDPTRPWTEWTATLTAASRVLAELRDDVARIFDGSDELHSAPAGP
ncbi:hypothetical protein ACN20G_02895 [Streptomyces sp. BI20]|uniref:hypothetical protein n=1 Tax=Streptomyces sp. BI20 TaxID=3403460 RepID=UPI003C7253A9